MPRQASWKIAVIAEGQGSWARYVRRDLFLLNVSASLYFTTFLSVKIWTQMPAAAAAAAAARNVLPGLVFAWLGFLFTKLLIL